MAKRFTKKVENFHCEVCGKNVKGDGYTDHCPNCLYSKHVDFYPGDRKADCGGLMEPIGVRHKNEKWQILYRCQKCKYKRVNQVDPQDNQEKITEFSQQPVRRV